MKIGDVFHIAMVPVLTRLVLVVAILWANVGFGLSSDDGFREFSAGWSYRWGDSPVDSNGKFEWLAPSQQSGDWEKLIRAEKLPTERRDNILWMRVRLPNEIQVDSGLFFEAIDLVFEAYVDGKIVYSHGQIVSSREIKSRGSPYHVIPLSQEWGGKELFLRIASNDRYIGIYKAPRYGKHSQATAYLVRRNLPKLVVAFLAMAIFLMSFLFLKEKSTRKIYVSLGLFGLALGLYMLARSKFTDHVWGFPLARFYVQNISQNAIPVLYLAFTTSYFGRSKYRFDMIFAVAFLVVLFASIATDVAGVIGMRSYLPLLWALFLATALYSVVFVGIKAYQGERDARIFLLGVLVLAATVVVDVGTSAGIWMISVDLLYWGFVAVLGALAYIVSERYMDVFKRRDFLHKRLETVLEATRSMSSLYEVFDVVKAGVRYLKFGGVIPTGCEILYCSDGANGYMRAQILEPVDAALVRDSNIVFSDEEKRQIQSIVEPALTKTNGLVIPLALNVESRSFLLVRNWSLGALADSDLEFIKAIVGSMNLAIGTIQHMSEASEKARMRTEILAAESVQQTLLPHPMDVDGVHIRTHSCLASEIGGDWFGYYHTKTANRLFFFIGDVTGHGIPSAIISGVACGAVYGCEKLLDDLGSRGDVSPEEHLLGVAASLNQVIYRTGRQADRLMTMALGCLDISTGKLAVINAGHPHPFVVSPISETVENIVSRGSRLGASATTKFDCKSYQLQPGDSVFLYTDGLLENATETGVTFSHLSLRKLLESKIDADDLNAVVLNHCNEIWGEKAIMPDDDVSLLTITWEGKRESTDTWGRAAGDSF